MNYDETLDYLYTAAPAFEKVGAGAYKEGLSNTLALDEHFGHPHRQYKTIHVAGTNGKGSTSHTLAAFLQLCGYKVGLYTSPHLVDFNERIRVNGEPMPHQYVIDFVEKERQFFEPLQPSFFELTTAMAFKYFAEKDVDIAVVEVGLGGRLDCTNIIQPVLSVITNISFDHTGFLGNTLEKIAGEKAGIIKKNIPVVIGEESGVGKVFSGKAKSVDAPIFFAEKTPMATKEQQELFALKGYCQEKNLNTILNAINVLDAETDVAVDLNCVEDALQQVSQLTGLRGRWETISDDDAMTVVCDTGHNLAGWQYLSKQIAEESKNKCLRMVFGMVDDKDIDAVMDLLPKDATYYFTQADTHRAIPAEQVLRKAKAKGLRGMAYDNVNVAYEAAISDAKADCSGIKNFIFVGGSSYVVADFLT